MRYVLLGAALFVLMFTGCSDKKYYEPKKVDGVWNKTGEMVYEISDVAPDGAMLDNGQLITQTGVKKYTIPTDYRFIAQSDGWYISATIDGNVTFHDIEGSRDDINITMKKTVASVSVKRDTVAVLFASNAVGIYSLSTGELEMKDEGSPAVAVDYRVPKPSFFGNLIIFMRLDGKITIINEDTQEVLRNILVSSEDYFNNVIYLNMMNNILIGATGYKMLAFGNNERRSDIEVRDIKYTGEGVWVTTKQGEVIAMTPELQVKSKLKFDFAHFEGMIILDKIYLLEKEGFMIVIEKDLSSFAVYEVEVSDGMVFVADELFFNGSRYYYVNDGAKDYLTNIQEKKIYQRNMIIRR